MTSGETGLERMKDDNSDSNAASNASDTDTDDLSMSPLEDQRRASQRLIGAHRWLRSRSGRLTVSAGCVLLVIATLVALPATETTLSLQTVARDLGFATPTPTTPILAEGDSFVLVNIAPWGKLTIDGKIPAITPQYDQGMGFALPRGVHHLVSTARHFPPMRCVISVPESASDSCPLTHALTNGVVTTQRFLDFEDVPSRLAPLDEQALQDVIAQDISQLSATATIEPGDSYQTSSGTMEIARAPLTYALGATVHMKTTPQSEPTDLMALCDTLCLGALDPDHPSPWILAENVDLTWSVANPAAQPSSATPIIESDQPQSLVFDVMDGDDSLWRAQLENQQQALASLAQTLAENAVEAHLAASTTSWDTTTGTNAAAGAVVFPLEYGNASLDWLMGQPILLWRFGILATINGAAAQQFPGLPRASPGDQALALSMLKTAIAQNNSG
jgi:hypothetical protein